MNEPDGASAGDVARRLGIAVTTLRTWHQRYGLGPSQHSPGRHRRYTATDLARLDLMAQLTARGLPAAEAARTVLAHQHAPATQPSAGHNSGGHDGGGHTIAVGPAAGPAARGLARAAMRLDTATISGLIAAAIRDQGVADTWNDLLCPVLVGLGKRHAATGRLIEVEHLLSRCISGALTAVPRPDDPARQPRLLLACAAEEQHTLPLEALAATLAEHGATSLLLAPRVPSTALTATIHRTRPTAVLIWSHTQATGDPHQLQACLLGRHQPLLAAAGPGWPDLPPTIERPADLTTALALLRPLAQ
ncbi:MerR family transcriptional regulator [Frankia sp. AgB1.9]|uniref:MerR family transcriptional regulator n=1 Tax=unclassified Frankia TaxID=2632575 RepID=UPI0019317088|nr:MULTISPECIES: MerR family transcriptional regulator [unclassified Frankia]MBL7488092.1 MerR family transcriptional regulator [Frankia sp. AgW1.1]MBL7548319.1 MerR family transcriptional regulator [Frankia sp. AgB1.9]MBL7625233.1 MerR family transcriptional regulator [Frankia sp. AgB1.8]